MKRLAIDTQHAPRAIGPYSQAIASDDWLYCSGQIALDPATGDLVAPDDVGRQAEQVLRNLSAVLAAGQSSFDQVVKTTIYLVDMADFGAVNEVYGKFFAAPAPARATVAVAALPRGARVEIDAIARAGRTRGA